MNESTGPPAVCHGSAQASALSSSRLSQHSGSQFVTSNCRDNLNWKNWTPDSTSSYCSEPHSSSSCHSNHASSDITSCRRSTNCDPSLTSSICTSSQKTPASSSAPQNSALPPHQPAPSHRSSSLATSITAANCSHSSANWRRCTHKALQIRSYCSPSTTSNSSPTDWLEKSGRKS